MINKFEFATYCLEVRKIHEQVGEWLDVDYILRYCNRNKKISLQKDIRIHEVVKGRKLVGHTFHHKLILKEN